METALFRVFKMVGMKTPTISYEFFPPKNDQGHEALGQAMAELEKLGPKYMTVTYGAGGSTKEGTRIALRRAIQDYPDVPMFSHLTFLSTTKEALDGYLQSLIDIGVQGIVALRGDLPNGTSFDDFTGDEYYKFTSDFVEVLKAKYPFKVIVGAYPEKHPDAPDLKADIEALRLKCGAGADSATTQFFFDNEVYYRFLDQCRAAGITTPINPGLIPVHDYTSLCRFAGKCGAQIPLWLHERFDPVKNEPEEMRKIAQDLLVQQSMDLAENGVSHIHYYCMNKAPVTREACMALGYQIRAAA